MRSYAPCANAVVRLITVVATALAIAVVVVAWPSAKAGADAGTGSITLAVTGARDVKAGATFLHHAGETVAAYKWIINVDDTGSPGTAASPGYGNCLPATAPGGSNDPDYADSCKWPSTRTTSGFAPIVAQGDEGDLSTSKALDALPAGKYLISVTADDYKIDGAHFTVTGGGSQRVTVAMQPLPLPLTTIRLQVFNDNAPVDGTWEADAEPGLRGATATLTDVLGLVSTDYYGNSLCTRYKRINASNQVVTAPVDSALPVAFDANDRPIVDTANTTGKCTSDATGLIVIPNLGPNRYAATVTAPTTASGQWVQTTTLEGAHDHDIWQQEGETGNDTEQLKGGEPVPSVQFGFAHTQAVRLPRTPPTGEIKGIAIAGLPYIGGQNGQVVPETGLAGAKSGGPIKSPWIAISDLDAGDAQIYLGRGNTDGSFDVKNLPDGTYQLTIWDDDQDYILWSFNVEVHGGLPTDVGNKMLVGWFTHIYGHVFVDNNGNGKRDTGEKDVPGFLLTVRERDNSLMDQYTNTVTTNDSGSYDIRETYPLGKWLVLEGFNTRFQTTGITYQAENDPKATTKLGSLVDVDFLPIIGLGGRIDWGVQPYDPGTNGGIVGTVTYDTTRNELDPADAVTESYQPGIPGIPVRLYVPVPCDANTPADHCRQGYVLEDDGSMKKGAEVQDAYTSEEWAAPRGCTARQYDGTPLTDQQALPEFGAAAKRLCVEAPMMGVQTGPSDDTPGAAGQTVNGNYGFGDSKINLWPKDDPDHNPDGLDLYAPLPDGQTEPLRAQEYIVSVDIPNDPVDGKPMYKVTSEEDVNVFDGDSYLPQQNFDRVTVSEGNDPPPGDQPTPTPPSQPPSQQAGIISPCAGSLHTVHVTDQPFADGGGSPFEGQPRPSCADKLVTVRTGQSTAPNFNLFTDVPIPTHFWGLTINDLGLSLDKRSANFGEAQGLPFVPVGLYDWSGRLLDTVHTDFNGMYEALEPSTDTYNCPVPAGPCANMYRFVGNDPGQPGALNPDYNPRFRTIATNFQGWPGLYTVTDTAPTQVAATALAPDTTAVNPTMCDLGANAPQLLAVDKPYVRTNATTSGRTVTVSGFGFGSTAGRLTLNGTTIATGPWSDTSITFTVPGTFSTGSARLNITRAGASGATSVNGLTLQVLGALNAATAGGSAANPRVYEVGPATGQYHTVQAAIEAAQYTALRPYDLIVVWPNAQTNDNPRGEYTENVILHHQVKIQGVGPGGFRPDNTFVPGSIIDGAGFNPDSAAGTAWINLLGSLRYSGDPAVPDAAVITVLSDPSRFVPSSWPTSIDGFTVTGGAQSDFFGNVNEITGVVNTPYGATGSLITQGGGIYVHDSVQNLHVTDNVIRGNGGSYGGGIRIGTPYVGNNRNYNALIADNQIRDNGGTNLAGGIGLFTGSDGYQVTRNAICGNFSAEYGGAVSAFGYNANTSANPGNTISKNRVWFNQSYDEGGAVMIAGELPATPTQLSEGSGAVSIDANVIQTNLANDDGGGIRLLQASGSHVTRLRPETISITNNTIANNVSAHEGGGIALDDAAFVNIANNTVAKNITTATAVTSDGQAAPAGLSTAASSDLLMSRLCGQFGTSSAPCTTKYSKPTLLNDVFWDNRAGSFSGGWVYGIDTTLPDGSSDTINHWDLGVVDVPGALLSLAGSIVQTTDGTTMPAAGGDPSFVGNYDVTVNVLASRTYPAFRQAVIVAEILPPSLMGDYHVGSGSSARGAGVASTPALNAGQVTAPISDIDGDPRPTVTGTGQNQTQRYDAGSDQMTP